MKYPLIEICIDTIEKRYNKVFTDYQELSGLIREQLKENISVSDILEYYEKYYYQKCIEAKVHLNQVL
jgi:hypothetical protein